jgi:hypothetical protein
VCFLEQLGFLALEGVVDRVDVVLGDGVEFLLGARDVVFADLFGEGIQLVLRLAAHVADRDLRVFALGAHDLDVFLATVFRHLGHRHPDDGAVVRRGRAEVGEGGDGALDLLERRLVVGRHDEGARLGVLQARELGERRRRSVVLDEDLLEEGGVRAPRAHGREVFFGDLDGPVHLLAGLGENIGDRHGTLLRIRLPSLGVHRGF